MHAEDTRATSTYTWVSYGYHVPGGKGLPPSRIEVSPWNAVGFPPAAPGWAEAILAVGRLSEINQEDARSRPLL